MHKNKPMDDQRLLSAVPFVRSDDYIADIGTDHAYLPIYLMEHGLCQGAVACDINRGPIDSADEHIRAAGLKEQIQTFQTDGLHGVEAYHPTTILIFGMGGELIAKILEEAPWIKHSGIRLVLQPMTHIEDTRKWLFDNGFSITEEVMSMEAGKIYFTLCAEYDGLSKNPTQKQCVLGNWFPMNPTKVWMDWVQGRLEHETTIRKNIETGTGVEAQPSALEIIYKEALQEGRDK